MKIRTGGWVEDKTVGSREACFRGRGIFYDSYVVALRLPREVFFGIWQYVSLQSSEGWVVHEHDEIRVRDKGPGRSYLPTSQRIIA